MAMARVCVLMLVVLCSVALVWAASPGSAPQEVEGINTPSGSVRVASPFRAEADDVNDDERTIKVQIRLPRPDEDFLEIECTCEYGSGSKSTLQLADVAPYALVWSVEIFDSSPDLWSCNFYWRDSPKAPAVPTILNQEIWKKDSDAFKGSLTTWKVDEEGLHRYNDATNDYTFEKDWEVASQIAFS